MSLNDPASGIRSGATIFNCRRVSAAAPNASTRTAPVAAPSGTFASTVRADTALGVTFSRPPPSAANFTVCTSASSRPSSWTREPLAATRTSAQRSMQSTSESFGAAGSADPAAAGVATPPPPAAAAMPALAEIVAIPAAIPISCRHPRPLGVPGSITKASLSRACGVS